jgi:hypothetical protein
MYPKSGSTDHQSSGDHRGSAIHQCRHQSDYGPKQDENPVAGGRSASADIHAPITRQDNE